MTRAVLVALLVTAACHSTVRSRTTPDGVVEEKGRCDSEDIGPHEGCTESEKFDETKTIVAAAIVVVLGIAVASSADLWRAPDH
jgi:hypothetical protein